jgi:hypothetical protein
MTLEEFKATTSASTPPAVSRALLALWHDARGEWDIAHEIANGVDDKTGAWVHAYCIEKKATSRTPPTGIDERDSRPPPTRSRASGPGSSRR